jgi:hypothetical protein
MVMVSSAAKDNVTVSKHAEVPLCDRQDHQLTTCVMVPTVV